MKDFGFDVTLGKNNQFLAEATILYTLFNGGEVNIKLPEKFITANADTVHVVCSLQNSNEVMALCMLVDALKRSNPHAVYCLALGYTPYARQDRVCNPGEALSIKVFANMINGLGFDEVCLIDPHSDVTGALINNVTGILEQSEILKDSDLNSKLTNKELISYY